MPHRTVLALVLVGMWLTDDISCYGINNFVAKICLTQPTINSTTKVWQKWNCIHFLQSNVPAASTACGDRQLSRQHWRQKRCRQGRNAYPLLRPQISSCYWEVCFTRWCPCSSKAFLEENSSAKLPYDQSIKHFWVLFSFKYFPMMASQMPWHTWKLRTLVQRYPFCNPFSRRIARNVLKYLWHYCFVIDPGHENISAHNIINKDFIILSKILKCLKISYHASVLSRNAFLGGGGWWKCSVPLSKHFYSSVFVDRQELTLCHYFNCNLEKIAGEVWVFRGEASPTPTPPVDWTLHAKHLSIRASQVPVHF